MADDDDAAVRALRKRAHDRERIAAVRAAMTPEERAARRRGYDEGYRARRRRDDVRVGRDDVLLAVAAVKRWADQCEPGADGYLRAALTRLEDAAAGG